MASQGSANAGTIRLMKEHRTVVKEYYKLKEKHGGKIPNNFITLPDPDNIYTWYFVIYGLTDEQYEGGFYLGKLVFPKEYPWKPPAILMLTETGRFTLNYKICLTISDYHPETWNPVWPVPSVVIGLISFFVTEDATVGSI